MRARLALALAITLPACGEQAQPEPAELQAADRFADVRLVVNADGVAAASEESALAMRFGSPRAEVERMAEASWGAEGETTRQDECGAGAMEFTSYGPLQLAFQDGRFAGWFLREGEGVATSDGIRPGAAFDALKSEWPVREIDSTLPGEFEYTTGDFGIIRGFSENDMITGLQAGLSCFFR